MVEKNAEVNTIWSATWESNPMINYHRAKQFYGGYFGKLCIQQGARKK